MAATVDSSHKEQRSCHADDGNDQRHTEAIFAVNVQDFASIGDVIYANLWTEKGKGVNGNS